MRLCRLIFFAYLRNHGHLLLKVQTTLFLYRENLLNAYVTILKLDHTMFSPVIFVNRKIIKRETLTIRGATRQADVTNILIQQLI